MKKFTFLAASLFFFGVALNAQTVTPTTNPNQVEQKDIKSYVAFSTTTYSFGKIPQGKPVEFEVEIKNISKDSLKIENIQVACGCTTPKYQQNVSFGPGQSTKVTLGFNAAAMGPFTKTATIYLTGGLTQVITFNGETYQVAENAAPANNGLEKLKPGHKH